MTHPILIPVSFPLDVGKEDDNGDRARYIPVLGLQSAVPHLALAPRRRGLIAGWTGRRVIAAGDDVYFRSRYIREQYTGTIRCRIWYSTSDPMVTAAIRIGTAEEDTGQIFIGSTQGPSIEEAVTLDRQMTGGNLSTADAGDSDLYVRVLAVQTAEPDGLAPKVYIWSIKWYIDALNYLELP